MSDSTETIYLAGGCLWGVQHFFKSVPGVVSTEAGRANGNTKSLNSQYDGYAECVRIEFNADVISVSELVENLIKIIDPYSVDKQGFDVGHKYRTGIYSLEEKHLSEAKEFLKKRSDYEKIKIEVKPLINYVRSADEHQDRLELHQEDYVLCHIPIDVMNQYRNA